VTLLQLAFITAILTPLVLALIAGRKSGRGWTIARLVVYAVLAVFFLSGGVSSLWAHRRDPTDGTTWWLMLLLGITAAAIAIRSWTALRSRDYRSLHELTLQEKDASRSED
jgi:uncharacterized membrane protein HdeD (DUF308 family)